MQLWVRLIHQANALRDLRSNMGDAPAIRSVYEIQELGEQGQELPVGMTKQMKIGVL